MSRTAIAQIAKLISRDLENRSRLKPGFRDPAEQFRDHLIYFPASRHKIPCSDPQGIAHNRLVDLVIFCRCRPS